MIVIDSSGWLEVIRGENNAELFDAPLRQPQQLIVPTICVAEVTRRMLIESREDEDILTVIGFMRTGEVVPLTDELAAEAARLGVQHKLPMADSIIYAAALAYDAELWTQDQDFAGLPGVHFIAKSD